MSIFKVKCSCNKLLLSETLSGYDTICDYDGRLCNATKYKACSYLIVNAEECKKHKEQEFNTQKKDDNI